MTARKLGPDSEGRVLFTERDRVVAATENSQPLDCSGAVLAPGRVNAHTHIYSGLAPLGMPTPEVKPQNFVQILERVWWRLDRALDESSLRAAARLYVGESLLFGTTTLIDHHESPNFIEGALDVLADTCDELGIRAVLCFGATERNGGREEGRRGLRECRRFLSKNTRPLIRGVVSLHASFTVSDDTIREAGELCQEFSTIMHVHLAEDVADVVDAKERGYPGPLQRLHQLGALPAGSILAHGVHLDATEVRLARDLGCWIVQNPRSNRGNGVGYPRSLGESDRVALGTDGYPSDLCEEKAALLAQARSHGESVALAAKRSRAAQELVAERFAMDFSRLRIQSAADVCAFEGDADTARTARHVVVGGRLVVEDGRLTTADMGAIHEEARREAPNLWRRMATIS